MKHPICHRFVEKAQAAMVSAIEIYNKPSFAYREETFSILALNAWELLLKAKILLDSKNHLNAIYVYETRKKKNGDPGKKKYVKKNRSGNPQTIALGKCIAILNQNPKTALREEIIKNLDALIEIRDNSTHYVHASRTLQMQILEIGFATVKNFVIVAKDWFGMNLEQSLSLCLPLSFISGSMDVASVVINSNERNLIRYLNDAVVKHQTRSSEFAVAVHVDVKIDKSPQNSAQKVRISNDPNAIPVNLREEDITQKYPWDYDELTKKLASRYSDFKQNDIYHKIRQRLEKQEKFVKCRYLNVKTKKGVKRYYNPNILSEFDKHYAKRT